MTPHLHQSSNSNEASRQDDGVALSRRSNTIKTFRHQTWDRLLQATDWATGKKRPTPSFLIGGGMRCGTTALFSYLVNHPELSGSRKKEVHYFDLQYHKGIDWYKRQFPSPRNAANGNAKLLFESSPYYMFEPRAAQRIKEALPNIKIIFLLRDPIERAISQYQKNIRDGRERLTLANALAAEEMRLDGEERKLLQDETYLSPLHQHFSYKARGKYETLLKRYYQHLGKNQILVIRSSSLFEQPAETLSIICEFIGIQQWNPDHFPVINSSQFKATLDATLRRQLEDEFEPHEQALERLIGWRSADWPCKGISADKQR